MRTFLRKLHGVLLLCLLTLVATPLRAQALPADDADCRNQALGAAQQAVEKMRLRQYQELARELQAWEMACDFSEPLFRLSALYLIQQGAFPAKLGQMPMLDYAIAYDIRLSHVANAEGVKEAHSFDSHPAYFGYIPPGSEFDRLTRQWALHLLASALPGSMEQLFLQLYAQEPALFFEALKAGQLSGMPLQEQYAQKVRRYQSMPEYSLGLHTGLWLPQKDLEVLGPHPFLGIMLGIRQGKNRLELGFDFRMGKSREEVLIFLNDSLQGTQNYQGAWLGLDYYREVYRRKAHHWGFYGGVGYDIIELVEDKKHQPQRLSFGAWAFSAGPAYRYTFSNRSWLHLRPVYHIHKHQNAQGSSLQGHAVSLKLTYGITDNPRRNENLRRLGHTP